MIQALVIYLIFITYALSVLVGFGTILTWVERKQAAVMSDRIGANRAYIRIPFTQIKLVWWGLFHGMADGLNGCPYAPGASGNIVTEDLVFMLDSMGLRTGIDLGKLLEVRRILAEALPGDALYGFTPDAGLPLGFVAATPA